MKPYKEDNLQTRVAVLENVTFNIHNTLIRLEEKLDNLDRKINIIEARLGDQIFELDKKLSNKIDNLSESINNRLWKNFYWMIAGFTGVLAMVAHVLHWI